MHGYWVALQLVVSTFPVLSLPLTATVGRGQDSGISRAALGLDDVCDQHLEASESQHPGCAFGALQHSVLSRLAAASGLRKAVVNDSGTRDTQATSSSNVALSALKEGAHPVPMTLPGPQFPQRNRRVNGWKVSQERWLAHGDSVPVWAQLPEVPFNNTLTHQHATLAAPGTTVAALLLCLVGLVICNRTVVTQKDKKLQRPAEDGTAASSQQADSRLPTSTKEDTLSGEPVSVVGLFRFATSWDVFCVVVALAMALTHGALMPLAFHNIDQIFECLYLPNDDGSIPPEEAPHTQRDAQVWKICRLYFATGAVIGTARTLSVLLMSRVAKRQARRMREAVFLGLLRQSPAWHDQHSPAELAMRVSADTASYQVNLAEKLLEVPRSIVLTLSSFLLAAFKDWKVAIVMGVTMPICGYACIICLNVGERATFVQQELYERAGGIAQNAMSLIRTVHAFGGQDKELARFQDNMNLAERKGNKLGLVIGFCYGVTNAVFAFALGLGIYSGSSWIVQDWEGECWHDDPPFGDCRTGGRMMACIYTLMWGFCVGLGSIQLSLTSTATAKTSAQRVYAIIDSPLQAPQGGQAVEKLEGHIAFDSVSFSYSGREANPALDHVSLRITAGSTCALVGRSGSGKSTMVSLLLRFYELQEGRILVDGQDIQGLNAQALRSHMALVEQEPTLFGTSIFENITYGSNRKVLLAEVERAAKLANAHEFISSFPGKYETKAGEQGSGTHLSGGQKQRIAIARALIRDPTILLLDEATSALDGASEKLVQDALDKLMQTRRRTTLVIAHRLSTVKGADKIAVFKDGRLAEEGTHSELLSQDGEYTKLVQSQISSVADPPLAENTKAHENDTVANEQRSESSRDISRASSRRSVDKPAPAAQLLTATKQSVNQASPGQRLWEESRPDACLYILGVMSLSLSAGTVPWYMLQFAQTVNIFNRPPAALDTDTNEWVGDFDEGYIAQNVNVFCFSMVCAGLLIVLLSTCSWYCFNRAAEALTGRLRCKAFRAVLGQDMTWHDSNSPGELAGRLAEQIPKVRLLVGNGLASGVQGILGVLLGLTIAFIFSWRFTLCILGCLPVLFISIFMLVWSKQMEGENHFGGLVLEALSSIKTVTAYDMEKPLMNHFHTYLDNQSVHEHLTSLFYGLGMGVFVGGIFSLLGADIAFANIFISRALMSPDRALVVFFGLVAASLSGVSASVWLGDRSLALKAADGLFELLDRETEIDNFSNEGKQPSIQAGAGGNRGCHIEFQDVYFHYATRPEMPVFRGLSFTMEPNTVTALVGPSGCGKSTAIGLLQRFYDPCQGVVRFNGMDIRELKLKWLREQMGLVQQEPVLFAGTIHENIRYGNSAATDDQIVSVARAANAHDFIIHFPLQYFTDVGNRGHALSGGQKQRIAIARALVRDPRLLLLDEATASLDATSEQQVQEALQKLLERQQRTTLVIAHRLSTIQGADQICVLNKGQIVQKGTHKELLSDVGGLYSQLTGNHNQKRS